MDLIGPDVRKGMAKLCSLNLFSFQIDWIKDKLDEIDANESPLAPQTRGIYSSVEAQAAF